MDVKDADISTPIWYVIGEAEIADNAVLFVQR